MKEKSARMLLLTEARLRNQYMRPRLLAMGLTPGQGQARILSCVLEHEHLSQRELSDRCYMDVTTMSRAIDKMEEAGYLVREPNPDSRRSYCIGLTEEGRKKAQEAQQLIGNLDEIIEGSMTEEERGVFIRVMEKICARLEAADA